MTYGETWYANKQKLNSMQGLEIDENFDKIRLPKKMNNADAGKYYNNKLFNYWTTLLSDNLKHIRKKQIISALMFGNIDAYKNMEGLRDANN